MSSRLGFAIVGLGRRAEMHANSISALAEGYLSAVCSRKMAKALEFSSRHGNPASYDEVEYLLDDRYVDVAVLASPPYRNLEIASMIIRSGRSLIIDSPLEVNAEKLSQLLSMAEEEGVFISSPISYAAHPLYRDVRDIIESGIIGKVRKVTLGISRNMATSIEASAWRNDKSVAGGGVLLHECYPYLVYFASLFGEGSVLSYSGDSFECERRAKLEAEYGHSIHLSLDASLSSDRTLPDSLSIIGENGEIHILGHDSAEVHTQNGIQTIIHPSSLDTFYGNYLSSIENGTASELEPDDLIAAMRIIDESYRIQPEKNQ